MTRQQHGGGQDRRDLYQHPRCTAPGKSFGSDEVSVNRCARYEGLAAFGEPVVRRILTGLQPNADTWIAAT